MDFLKICDNMNTKVVDVKIKPLFKPTMVIQFLLLIVWTVIGIIFIFNHNMDNIFYGLGAANLLMLAFNKYFHKKYMNYLYILFALFLIISIIIDIW